MSAKMGARRIAWRMTFGPWNLLTPEEYRLSTELVNTGGVRVFPTEAEAQAWVDEQNREAAAFARSLHVCKRCK